MRVLITGSRGRLGSELIPRLKSLGWQLFTPTSHEFDITDEVQVTANLDQIKPDLILHLAAYTDVAKAEKEKDLCWRTNVIGTRNLARNTKAKLVHISTDYVFDGQKGNYRENDTPNPINYYALTKLVAEEAVQLVKKHLIVRTSFKPSLWPYSTAFIDQFTSADYVDVIADEMLILLKNIDLIMQKVNIIHIGTERKSVFELALKRNPDVKPMKCQDVPVPRPPDISLNLDLWKEMKLCCKQKL